MELYLHLFLANTKHKLVTTSAISISHKKENGITVIVAQTPNGERQNG